MALNPYFKNFKSARHQSLIERQIIESIKRQGYDIKYIPRKIVKNDKLFGEDVLSRFEKAAEIEAFVKNVDGYEGQGRIMAKFGIEVRDKITFTISRKRFDEIRNPKLLNEQSYVFQNEDKPVYTPFVTHGFLLEDADDNAYYIEEKIPVAGDLIYFGMVDKIFQITYVNKEAFFYQHGALYTWDIECELFEYSSEVFETDEEEIDSINRFNVNKIYFEFLLEDGFVIRKEDGASFISEEQSIEDVIPDADNETISKEVDSIIDWSEVNPLITTNSSRKW